MPLPAFRERLSAISTQKKLLFVVGVSFVLILFLLVVEAIYCFSSEACLLNFSRSFPSIGKMVAVQETDLAFRKGNIAISKSLKRLEVSGEIAGVEKDSLALWSEGDSKEYFFVQEGSELVIYESIESIHEGIGEKHIFDGSNLKNFLSPGFFLFPAPLISSTISSKYTAEGITHKVPIIVVKKP